MKKQKPTPFSLAPADAPAILAALPLVSAFSAETELQQQINNALSLAVVQKLVGGQSVSFSAQECRIIYAAVSAAKLYLSGWLRDSDLALDLSVDEVAELRKHLFTYNRLEPPLRSLVESLKGDPHR